MLIKNHPVPLHLSSFLRTREKMIVTFLFSVNKNKAATTQHCKAKAPPCCTPAGSPLLSFIATSSLPIEVANLSMSLQMPPSPGIPATAAATRLGPST